MQLWRYGLPIERLGNRYRLEGSLGSGGMADVCLAWDEQGEREVAIKVIKADELEQRTLNRFLKEAAQVSKWRHPHILRFYGEARLELLDPAKGSVVPYIVMEYAQGGDLAHRLQKGRPYPLPDTLQLFSQLCSGVAYAHAHGLIHRDLKPQNILFRRLANGSEQALISDFGLAIEVSATHHTFARGGTLPYMAPEQLRGTPIPASDIFALGVILYQLCTGRLPFRRSLQDLRLTTPLPRPPLPSQLNSALPIALDAVILQALAEDPAQRYADADQFWSALQTQAAGTTYRTSSGRISSVDKFSNRPPTTLKLYPESASTLVRPPDTHLLSTHSQPEIESDSYSSLPLLSSSAGSEKLIPRRSSARSSPVTPVPRTNSTRSTTGVIRRKRPTLFLLLLPLPLLFLAAFSLFFFFGAPKLPKSSSFPSLSLSPAATATVAPDSIKTISQNYTFPLTHDPAPTSDHVLSRTVSTTATTTQIVATTGKAQTQGIKAKGQVQFLNGAFVSQTVPAGTVVIGSDGIQVISDENAVIPAADANVNLDGRITVNAHSANAGSKGNILALDINKTCCVSNGSIVVKNLSAFSGGQDPQNYHYPTDTDLSQVANTNRAQLEQSAKQQLQGQLASGELLAGDPSCQLKSTSDQPVGAQGKDLPQVTVTATDTCQGEAYFPAQVQSLVTTQLQQQALQQYGSHYKLVGDVQITTSVQAPTGPNALPVLTIQAIGKWKYAFVAT